MENMNRAEKTPLFARTGVVIALAIVCNALWGSAFPVINLGYRLFDIPSGDSAAQILFAGVRFFLSGVLTILFTSIPRKQLVRPKRENLHMVLKLAMLQTVIQYTLFYTAAANTSSVRGSIIQGMTAFIAILVSCYVFGTEKMNRLKWIGGALGVLGVIVMNLGKEGLGGGMKLTGEGFLFMSMFVSGCSSGTIRIFSQKEDPVALSGWQFTLGGLILTGAGLAFGGRLTFSSAAALAVLLYLAALSAIAYTVWSVLLRYNPVSRIAPFMFLRPIFGVAISLILYGGTDTPLAQVALALALVCASIVVVGKGQRMKA